MHKKESYLKTLFLIRDENKYMIFNYSDEK